MWSSMRLLQALLPSLAWNGRVVSTASAGPVILLVSAIASGQGKTTVTAALARQLANQGKRVRVFKTGPDFLDPMMLAAASRAPVASLDLWIVGKKQCRQMLAQAASQADVILIEGVMGLYDGNPSSADLAREFAIPVLLVLDAAKMAQTAGALALGLRDYGGVNLAGVVANRVGSTTHAAMISQALRGIPLLGTLPRQQQSLPERHLGLVQPGEVQDIDGLLDQLAGQLALDEKMWAALPRPAAQLMTDHLPEPVAPLLQGKVIAIARDPAFAFLYPANIACLQTLGAKLQFFSPLYDEPIPVAADAVYLPGGYPELHARALSAAHRWTASVRAFCAAGKPLLAECGGMMALAEQLTDMNGVTWPMAGILPGHVSMQARLAALGSQGWATASGELRGHTFHYSRFETSLQPLAHASKHPSRQPGEAIYRHLSVTASYFHAYFPSDPLMVAELFSGVQACEKP